MVNNYVIFLALGGYQFSCATDNNDIEEKQFKGGKLIQHCRKWKSVYIRVLF